MHQLLKWVLLMTSAALVGVGCTAPRAAVPLEPLAEERLLAPLAIVQLNGGTATMTRGDETDDVPNGLELMPGDMIRVTSGTIALVYVGAGASWLETGTEVTVLPDGEGDGSVFTQIELTAGSIWTRLERLLGRDEHFSVSSNGVVATVRGTAFGVMAVDGEAEIHVAESGVDVNTIEPRKDRRLAAQSMRVSAGEKMRVSASVLKKMDDQAKKMLIQKISDREKRVQGFLFAMRKMDEKFLRGPDQRVRLNRAMRIPDALMDRVDPRLLERILQMNTLPQFVSPSSIQQRFEFFETLVSSTVR